MMKTLLPARVFGHVCRHRSSRCARLAALSWLLAAGILTRELAAQPQYQLNVLNTKNYPQIDDSWLFDLNNLGDATGYVRLASTGQYAPVVYRDGALTTLPVPIGINPQEPLFTSFIVEQLQNYGSLINDNQQVVGYFAGNPSNSAVGVFTANGQERLAVSAGWLTPTGPQAFPFELDTPISLKGLNNVLPEGVMQARPVQTFALNNRGQIATFRVKENPNPNILFSATILDGTQSVDLEWLDSVQEATAGEFLRIPFSVVGFTDVGQFIVGIEGITEAESWFYHFIVDVDKKSATPMARPTGAAEIVVLDMDQHGVPFGYSLSASPSGPQLLELLTWNLDGTIREHIPLPPTPGEFFARNSLGQVVSPTTQGPMLYDGKTWQPILIGNLNGRDMSIYSLNDRGQFIGLISEGDQAFGFMASPIPEPSSAMLLMLGVTGIVARLRRSRQYFVFVDGQGVGR